jgi:hypothetical protein
MKGGKHIKKPKTHTQLSKDPLFISKTEYKKIK